MRKISWKYYISFIIAIVLIGAYGKYRCNNKTFKDPLEKQIIFGLDGWSVTHLVFFMIMGYLYPNTIIQTTSMGILWELFEHLYGKHRPGWLGGYGDCNDLATDKEGGNWWYGKWSDIVCNTAGFLVGRGLRGFAPSRR